MIRIGVLGTANIAEKRMIPAILKHDKIEYAGTAIASAIEYSSGTDEKEAGELWTLRKEKANGFKERFGGEAFFSFEALLNRSDIDAVYIPLPPALHEKWAKKALLSGKHILMEKPFTICVDDTNRIINMARTSGMAVLENYGFCYHDQMRLIQSIVSENLIGSLRLIRTSFGFPQRGMNDFRYHSELGGGALLDCGGYTIKAATMFMNKQTDVICSSSMFIPEFDVDISGSGMLCDSNGLCAQFSYGMDNAYKCEMELWGTNGFIRAPRIFTAPNGYDAPVHIQSGNDNITKMISDNQFLRILDRFYECIERSDIREASYQEIVSHGLLVDKCKKK